jgi:hypothetical protein
MIKTKWIEISWCSDEQTLAIQEKITKYKAILEISHFLTDAHSCMICFPPKSFPEFSLDFLFLHINGLELENYNQYVISDFSMRPFSEAEIEYREHRRWVKQAYTDKPLPPINKHGGFIYNSWQVITGFRLRLD